MVVLSLEAKHRDLVKDLVGSPLRTPRGFPPPCSKLVAAEMFVYHGSWELLTRMWISILVLVMTPVGVSFCLELYQSYLGLFDYAGGRRPDVELQVGNWDLRYIKKNSPSSSIITAVLAPNNL